jgi:Ice-binding-like
VALIRGASPCNVFWQVTSSATLGSGSTFVGTIMAMTDITMANGVTVNGRALARNGAVTLINDKINNSCSTKLTYTGSTAAAPGASITLRATLKTSAGVAIAGQTVTFTLNGVTRSATTSSSGVASVVTKAPTALGTYAIKITFAGVSTSASLRVGNAGLPNSATLAPREVPGSGPTPVVFVGIGILVLAFVVACRLWLRPIRTR